MRLQGPVGPQVRLASSAKREELDRTSRLEELVDLHVSCLDLVGSGDGLESLKTTVLSAVKAS